MNSIKIIIITLNILVATISCDDKKGNHSITPHHNTAIENQEFYKKKVIGYKNTGKKIKNKKMKGQQNYPVLGTDEDGNLVTGEVVIEGKAGFGSLIKIDKSKIEIIVEWSANKNRLIATDEYGYLYQLHIEE